MIENLFLSVGAVKAGTTWLYKQLQNHPDIYFTPEKELYYFSHKDRAPLDQKTRMQTLKLRLGKYCNDDLKNIAKHIDEIAWFTDFARSNEINNEWYENLFRMKKSQKYCADFSNLYCQMNQDEWRNVYLVAKNIKVIHTLRDPIARLWSHYKFHMKWIKLEKEALNAGFEHFKRLIAQFYIIKHSDYVRTLKLLRENIAQENLLILYFEDFREHPIDKLIEIYDFLNIEHFIPETNILEKKFNATKDFDLLPEWLNYMKEKLYPLCKKMKAHGIWHQNWQDI